MSNPVHLLNLPWNILTKILENLSLTDIRNVMLTCRWLLNFVLSENSLWRSLYRSKFMIHYCADNDSVHKLSVYQQCRISHNWIAGYYKKRVLLSHRINYMPWLKYCNSEALILSFGSQLSCYSFNGLHGSFKRTSLWNLEVPTIKRHDVRTNDISRFIIKNNYIACGNRDGCVTLYRFTSLREKPHLVRLIKDCHDDGKVEVTAVELLTTGDRVRVVTASDCSNTVVLWDGEATKHDGLCDSEAAISDAKSGRCVAAVKIDNCIGVRCIAANLARDTLAIGPLRNSKPFLLNILTGQIKTKIDNSDSIRDLIWLDHNNITYVTHSGMLMTVDTRTEHVVYSARDPFWATLYCVRSDGNHALVVGSSQYSRCVLFDVRNSRKHVQLYFAQKRASPVYCLDFDPKWLITAADRGLGAVNFDVSTSNTKCYDNSDFFM